MNLKVPFQDRVTDSVCRGLLSTLARGSWWGDKQAASQERRCHTAYAVATWFEKQQRARSELAKLRCSEIWKANIICLNSILLSDLTWLLMYSGVAGLCCSVGGGEGLCFWPGRILWTSVNCMCVSDFGTSQGCPVKGVSPPCYNVTYPG